MYYIDECVDANFKNECSSCDKIKDCYQYQHDYDLDYACERTIKESKKSFRYYITQHSKDKEDIVYFNIHRHMMTGDIDSSWDAELSDDCCDPHQSDMIELFEGLCNVLNESDIVLELHQAINITIKKCNK